MKEKIFIILLLIITYSCQTSNSINLSNNDYKIIEFSETFTENNKINKILTIEIINNEIIDQLEKIINPIIILNFNNKKYTIKGQLYSQSHRPINLSRDYYWFFLDEKNKLYNFQNNILYLIGYEN